MSDEIYKLPISYHLAHEQRHLQLMEARRSPEMTHPQVRSETRYKKISYNNSHAIWRIGKEWFSVELSQRCPVTIVGLFMDIVHILRRCDTQILV